MPSDSDLLGAEGTARIIPLDMARVTDETVAASLARQDVDVRSFTEGARAWAIDQGGPVDWPTWQQAMSVLSRRFPESVPDFKERKTSGIIRPATIF